MAFNKDSFSQTSFSVTSWLFALAAGFVNGLSLFVSAPIKKLWLSRANKAVTIRKAP